MSEGEAAAAIPQPSEPAAGPRYRRSHPYRAFVIMTAPFLALPVVVFIPFVGLVVLLVVLPIEFGRIAGRRIARSDALWVAVPAAAAVATYEMALLISILQSIPGTVVEMDAYGALIVMGVYGLNLFFFSVGALSTAFDPHEPVAPEAAAASAP